MPESTRKTIHISLSEDLHAELFAYAEQRGEPATVLAREAIEAWIERQRKEQLAQEILTYATDVAGSDDDLDPELAEAAEEELFEIEA
jgi:predicted DNA-binding protein